MAPEAALRHHRGMILGQRVRLRRVERADLPRIVIGGRRAYEKVGFKVEGRLRQDRFHGGRFLDTIVMGLLRDELVR